MALNGRNPATATWTYGPRYHGATGISRGASLGLHGESSGVAKFFPAMAPARVRGKVTRMYSAKRATMVPNGRASVEE